MQIIMRREKYSPSLIAMKQKGEETRQAFRESAIVSNSADSTRIARTDIGGVSRAPLDASACS